MTNWRNENRTCRCGERFKPKREAQAYCSKRCANAATQRRKRSGDKSQEPTRMTRPLRGILTLSVTALRWFGRSGTSTQAQHRGLFKAMTLPLNTTRTAIRSCQRVSIAGVNPNRLRRQHEMTLTPRSAEASFGPDIPTCGRKENLIVPRSADLGKGLHQARRRGRTPPRRSSGIPTFAGSACCSCRCE
jgi:hypothetical protein